MNLEAYGRGRDALLARIRALLQADPRVDAAWLSGSFGRGEADAWSDLDLHVAVRDAELDAFLAERPALYARVGRPVLVQHEFAQSNSLPGARFQLVWFEGPYEVDWSIGPTGTARRAPASLLLFERVPMPPLELPALTTEEWRERLERRLEFFWAMAPIAVKYAGRGDVSPTIRQIDLLSTALIQLWRLLREPDGPDPWQPNLTNRPLEDELDARLPRLGGTADPAENLRVIRALCAEAEQLHDQIAALGIAVPDAMPQQVQAISQIAEQALARGERQRRKYR